MTQEADRDARSRTLGPYAIVREIGRGGMGVVYEAFHPGLKRSVALKVLVAGEDAAVEAVARFRREAEAVAKLGHHPNIVPVHDVGSEGDGHYIAMHYVAGRSLDAVLDEGAVEPRQAAAIAEKIAGALAHAHAHGVLHRDVKPANILLAVPEGAHGEPMLTDFGLARDVEARSRMTRSGMTLGTPQYMPPEQADGRLDEVDERSDVYSLGATLYEMLALRPPFEGDSLVEVFRKIFLTDPVAPRRLNPLVDRDLETICLKCLEKDPERRYGSARELARDLERYRKGEAIRARPPSLGTLLGRRLFRHKVLAAVTAAAAILVAVGAAASLRAVGRESRARKAEAGRADRAERDRARAEQRQEKGREVASVLLNAYARLGEAQRELKRGFFAVNGTEETRRACFETHRPQIEEFCEGARAAGGPAAAATAEAVRGWLLRLGGQEARARAAFEAARAADPQVSWGWLFEAMACLSTYLVEHAPAQHQMIQGRIALVEIVEETPAVREARERFETLIRALRAPSGDGGAAVPGDEAPFIAALGRGLRALADGALDAAEDELSRARQHWAAAWMEEELLFARARVRYMRMNFDGGLKDIEAYAKLCPGPLEARHTACMLLGARGTAAQLAGEDGRPWHQRAVDVADEVLRSHPRVEWWARPLRGTALRDLAEAERAAGEDPRPTLRRALEDFDASLALLPGRAYPFAGRGVALELLGEAEGDRGGDPRDLYRRALADHEEVLRLQPGLTGAWANVATVSLRLGEAQGERGLDPEPAFRRALEASDQGLEGEPGSPLHHVNRGAARGYLAGRLLARGEDPSALLLDAVADYDAALEKMPHLADAYNNRGLIYMTLGQLEASRGGDPRGRFHKAVADLGEGLARNPTNVGGWANRANVCRLLGESQAAYGEDPVASLRRAVADCDEALRRIPGLPIALNNRALARLSLGLALLDRGEEPGLLFEDGAKDVAALLEADPASWRAFAVLASIFEVQGRFAEAAEAFAEASRLTRGQARIVETRLAQNRKLAGAPPWRRTIGRAEAVLRVGFYRAARAPLEEGLQAARDAGAGDDPRNRPALAGAHYNLACVYASGFLGRGDPEGDGAQKALSNLKAALDLGYADRETLRRDVDLDALRGLPAFEELLKATGGSD